MARRCLLPGIRCDHGIGSLPKTRGSPGPGAISTMCLAARQRPLLPRETGDCERAIGQSCRTTSSLAVARWRMELRTTYGRGYIVLLGVRKCPDGAHGL